MIRQRKLTKERKELISQLLTTYQPEDAGDRYHEDKTAYVNDNEGRYRYEFFQICEIL